MKKSLLMTASVLVLFSSLVFAGTGAIQKSTGKGLTTLEHGLEF